MCVAHLIVELLKYFRDCYLLSFSRHLEARFSSQKEAKEHMEVINSTIFKNGKKLKASILGPGGGPMGNISTYDLMIV